MGRGSALLVLLALLAACGRHGDARPTWTGATALTGTQHRALGVATDGTQVVFATAENAVRVVPLDASAPGRALVTDLEDLVLTGALALSGGTIHLGAGRSVLTVPLAGGPVAVLAADRPGTITSLAVDRSYVWWTTSALGPADRAEVARAPRAGGAVEVVAGPGTGSGSYASVVPDGSGGAYAASAAGIVHAVPGRAVEVVTAGAVASVVFDGDLVFGAVAGGELFAVEPSGAGRRQLSHSVEEARGLAVFAGGVAFFDGDALRWVPAGGGEPVTLASGPAAEGGLASTEDDVLVFPADRRVWKAVRPPAE